MATQFTEYLDDIGFARSELAIINKRAAELKKEIEAGKERLLDAMDAAGVDQVRNDILTATLTETIVPQVENWDEFYEYIAETESFHLLERRPSSVAYREALELREGKLLPGVQSFTKRDVGFRKR